MNLDVRLIIKIKKYTVESFKLPLLGSRICEIPTASETEVINSPQSQ